MVVKISILCEPKIPTKNRQVNHGMDYEMEIQVAFVFKIIYASSVHVDVHYNIMST